MWLVIDVCNDVLWFADIAFNFRTGFFKKGGSSLGASVDLLASVDDGTAVVDVEMGGGERRDSTASIPDLE